MFSIIEIETFLQLGYFLNYENNDIKYDINIDKRKYQGFNENELIKIGKEILFDSFQEIFVNNKQHLVPISGGLDSRAIISVLSEFTEIRNIATYTFGTKESLDFQIGNEIAKVLETKHEIFDLNNYEYKTDKMLDFAKAFDFQTLLFHHPPIDYLNKYKNHDIWSGFQGDNIAGSKLCNKPKEYISINDAKRDFIKKNYFVKSIDILDINNAEILKNVTGPNFSSEEFNIIEQLDLYNRQPKFIAPHVLAKGFNYQTPFNNIKWIDFMLSQNFENRYGTSLYKKILMDINKEMFSLPTTKNSGAKMNANFTTIALMKIKNKLMFKKHFNYLNFEKAIRFKKDINLIIKENVNDFNNRNIIELDALFYLNQHLSNKANYSDILLSIASLEIILKAKEKL